MADRECFLLVGHENPDEDCIASMVACALLLTKFSKEPYVYIGGDVHEHLQYLLDICRYNSIGILRPEDDVLEGFDTVIICDTPKPSMIDRNASVETLMNRPEVVKVEIDHHMGADSEYSGDSGYRLVTEASSTSELIGLLALRLKRRGDLLTRYEIPDPLSRNLVLAVLTGIIGDSKMGQFLKSRRERRFYRRFSRLFNGMLEKATVRETNFSDKDQVFSEIQRLSNHEQLCFGYFVDRKIIKNRVGAVALNALDVEQLFARGCDAETIVSAARAVADTLAEESGFVSLVVYYDHPEVSDLVQCRVRRSRHYKRYDLRELLPVFDVPDGGGHEGAIGFRLRKATIPDYEKFIEETIRLIEATIPA